MVNFFDNKARAAAGASSKSKPVVVAEKAQPWVEKYRPKELGDVKAQDHVINVLQRMLGANNAPHFLFFGPPGNGKTSTILAMCRQLFGPKLLATRVLELNASDERGISIIRTKVKDFARLQLSNAPVDPEYRCKYPCPPFRVCILDEADALSQDAQSALRRVLEIHSATTRFCLICNYVTRIIDPISSRCSKFRFKSLTGDHAGNRLRDIAKAEGVDYEDGVIERLLEVSEGDLRRAVTYLQSSYNMTIAAAGGGKVKKSKKVIESDDSDVEMSDAVTLPGSTVSVRTIEEVAGVIPPPVINGLISSMRPQKNRASSYEAVSRQVTDMVADGWSANQILSQLYTTMVEDDTIDIRKKPKLLAIFSETDKRLIDGSEEQLTILDLSLRLSAVLGQK